MIAAPILQFVLPLAIGGFALAVLLGGWRLLRGPSLPDRILALDTLYIDALGLLLLVGLRVGSQIYFEVAVLIALLGFISTVVLSKFILRGDIVE
jgi:multicomponent K+:H+ antiporter subunit F